LSRAKNSNGLRLLNVNSGSFITSKSVIEFYNKIKN
jgi:hypothetical protein